MPDKDEIKEAFARNLCALIEYSSVRKGKTTQRELAQYLGITPQAVSAYCNGLAMPDYSLLLKIAAFFGETTDYLLTGNRPQNKSAHELLGLSDDAIERLKSLHCNKKLDEHLLPFVDNLLSDSEFYHALYSATTALETAHIDFKKQLSAANKQLRLGVSAAEFSPIIDYSVSYACDKMDFFFHGFFGAYKDTEDLCDMVRKVYPWYLEMMQGDNSIKERDSNR